MTDSPPSPGAVGFLTILHDASGLFGGYLVTNAWGRPLEFRLTTAVQPNRVQQILYGPTLTEYLHVDLIGKTLVEKTSTQPTLIVSDSPTVLSLRSRVGIPVVAFGPANGAGDVIELPATRSAVPLLMSARYPEDRPTIDDRLEQIDPAVDLMEPFARIREAMTEARKMGVTGRAA